MPLYLMVCPVDSDEAAQLIEFEDLHQVAALEQVLRDTNGDAMPFGFRAMVGITEGAISMTEALELYAESSLSRSVWVDDFVHQQNLAAAAAARSLDEHAEQAVAVTEPQPHPFRPVDHGTPDTIERDRNFCRDCKQHSTDPVHVEHEPHAFDKRQTEGFPAYCAQCGRTEAAGQHLAVVS